MCSWNFFLRSYNWKFLQFFFHLRNYFLFLQELQPFGNIFKLKEKMFWSAWSLLSESRPPPSFSPSPQPIVKKTKGNPNVNIVIIQLMDVYNRRGHKPAHPQKRERGERVSILRERGGYMFSFFVYLYDLYSFLFIYLVIPYIKNTLYN